MYNKPASLIPLYKINALSFLGSCWWWCVSSREHDHPITASLYACLSSLHSFLYQSGIQDQAGQDAMTESGDKRIPRCLCQPHWHKGSEQQEFLSQTRWKARTNYQSCSLISAQIPAHLHECACTQTHAHMYVCTGRFTRPQC